jgi:RHS repeat-associated protein
MMTTNDRTTTTGCSVGNTTLFTGRRYEPETGLYHYRARFYSPKLGRFLQPDPIGYAGGINVYAYCMNDPLNATDPTGLDIYADFGGGGPVGLFISDPSSSSGWRSYDFSPVSGGWNDWTLNLLFGPSNTSLIEWPLPNPPSGSTKIPTTPQQDSRALCLARQSAQENFPYCAAFNNCAHMSRMILNGSGIPLGNRMIDTPSILQRDVNRYLNNTGTLLHIR